MKRLMSVAVLLLSCLTASFSQDSTCVKTDSLKWERKVKENDLYRIVVSGYEPKIDTVEIYLTPQVTTKYLIRVDDKKKIKRKRKDNK